MKKRQVLVIVGPTASGKSNLAVRLAKEFGAEIMSADSRQVYKGLDVGTGKITIEEMRGVPHHMLDVADPMKQFSAYMYQKMGGEVLKQIISRGNLPIIVGGTGLYIDALSCNVNFPSVPPNPSLRKELGNKNLEDLLMILDKEDPIRAQEVDRNNKLRIIRALEIIETLGHVPKIKSQDSAYEFVYIGIRPDKEVLEERINKRLEQRLKGIINECKKLLDKGLSPERLYELGLEYRYVGMYLDGNMNIDDLREKLFVAIKQYAKRQMTWFKRSERIKWFILSSSKGLSPDDYEDIEKYVKITLSGVYPERGA